MQSSDILTLSVVIPVFRGGDDFKRCMQALSESNDAPTETIVVADGGLSGTPTPEERSDLQIIETPERRGPGAARNYGAKAARGDILVFIDADVAIKTNCLGEVRRIFQEKPEFSALFGSYDDAPEKKNFLSQYRNLLHHYVHQYGNEEASSFWTGFGAIRRDIFEDLGGFNESLAGVEDIELGYRLKRAGYRILLCKTLEVKHLKYWTATSILKTDFFQRALPWTKLMLKNPSVASELNIDRASKMSVIAAFCLMAGLLGVLWWPTLWFIVLVAAWVLLFLNRSIYLFFKTKRGVWFALKAIVCHWIYFFYSGIAFAIGLTDHLRDRIKNRFLEA